MAKNVGKTTTLNYILKALYGKKRIGLTSIGRDGEAFDTVSHHVKPSIYVACGTIIATTTSSLSQSDMTKKILETTNIHTPMGDIVVVEAMSDGFVDLAGPSTNSQLKQMIKILKKYQTDLILIDGAISRKSFAIDEVSDGTILVTGAAYASDMDTVVSDTAHIVSLFLLDEFKSSQYDFKKIMKKSPVTLITKDNELIHYSVKTALNTEKLILSDVSQDSRYLLISGALTDQLMKQLIHKKRSSVLQVIIAHPTKCFISKEIYEKLERVKIQLNVLSKTELICVTYNPDSPYGYHFKQEAFKKALSDKIKLPIYNVMRDDDE